MTCCGPRALASPPTSSSRWRLTTSAARSGAWSPARGSLAPALLLRRFVGVGRPGRFLGDIHRFGINLPPREIVQMHFDALEGQLRDEWVRHPRIDRIL